MRNFTKSIGAVIIVFVVFYIISGFIWPVAQSGKDSEKVTAVVTKITEGGLQDIVLSLDKVSGLYYISSKNKQNLNLEYLNFVLLNKRADVYYAKPRGLGLLSPMASTLQITELRVDGKVIYSMF